MDGLSIYHNNYNKINNNINNKINNNIMLKRKVCTLLYPCFDTKRPRVPIIPPPVAPDLPEEVVSVILSKLVSSPSPSSSSRPCSLADYARFPAVSSVWKRAFEASKIFDHLPIKLPAQLPLLLIQNNNDDLDTRYFYSLYDGKLHNFPLRGQSSHRFCRGSSYGWLLTVDDNLTALLFNPFKSCAENNEIKLPPLFSLYPYLCSKSDSIKRYMRTNGIKKAAFSRSPSSTLSDDKDDHLIISDKDDHLIIMVITEEDDLGFYRLGETQWMPYPSPFRPPGDVPFWSQSWCDGGFQDVIYHKGKFHAIIGTGLVACLDLRPEYYPFPMLTVLDVEKLPPVGLPGCHWVKRYLVESSGDLLQVLRGMQYIDPRYRGRTEIIPVLENGHVTGSFEVFKLMDKRWVQIKSLNGWSLFLGDNTSFSVPAYNFPAGCIKPNHIYFTDDYGFYSRAMGCGPLDCGVFNLEDGSFEGRSPIGSKFDGRPFGLFPHWLQLML